MLPMLNRRWRLSRASGLPSLPRLETSFMPVASRLSCGLVTLPPRASSMAPKLTRERHLLLVGQLLAGEDQHGILVHAGLDGGHLLRRQRLGDIDAGDLADDCGMDRADGEGHGRSSHRVGFVPLSLQAPTETTVSAMRPVQCRKTPTPTDSALLHQRRCPVGGANATPLPGTTRACLTRRGPAPRQSVRVRARRCPVPRSRVAHRR